MNGTHVFVPGTPAPQGSAKGFPRKGGGVIITHDNARTEPWRETIRVEIMFRYPSCVYVPVLTIAPVSIDLEFVMPRRNREPKHPVPHTRKPDTDKLIRAVLDALTGLVYRDDSQVVEFGHVIKRTAEPDEEPGVHITWREYRQAAS